MNINKLTLNGKEYNLTDKDAQSKIASLQENTYTKTEVDNLVDAVDSKIEGLDLTPYETKEGAASKYLPKGNYLTEHQSLANYYTKAEVNTTLNDYAKKSELPSEYDDTALTNRVTALESIDHSKYLTEHQDISNLATKDEVNAIKVPTKVSELTNDSKYQTESLVNASIQAVVGAAPEALNTLEEIAAKLSDNDDAVAGIVNTLSTKADSSALDNYYNKTEVDSKVADAVTNGVNSIDLSVYETIEGASGKYQPKGNYLTEHLDISGKVDKEAGKGLSTNDYTDTDKAKLDATPTFWVGTQAEYDAIAVKDSKTFYYITE